MSNVIDKTSVGLAGCNVEYTRALEHARHCHLSLISIIERISVQPSGNGVVTAGVVAAGAVATGVVAIAVVSPGKVTGPVVAGAVVAGAGSHSWA